MGLQEVISWYQKKIGTYDKQQWERTVEQRILDGITHVPMKSARVKTELIDVDLVRGSSFPKAKPKHGLVTVFRLAFLRLFLLPLYSKWWVQQTSARIFGLLLALYGLQCVNLAAYTYHNEKHVDEHEKVAISELIVPMAMMMLLSTIHSQIVSTNPGPMKISPRRLRRGARKRRRPSFARSRNQSDSKLSDANGSSSINLKTTESEKYFQRTTTARVRITQSGDCKDPGSSASNIRRRFVGWESPLHHHVTAKLSIETTNNQQQKMAETADDCRDRVCDYDRNPGEFISEEFISAELSDSVIHKDCCESLQVFSSVLKPGTSSSKIDRDESENGPVTPNHQQQHQQGEEQEEENSAPPLDDDGFESLNGNASSENGEETARGAENPAFDSDESLTPTKLKTSSAVTNNSDSVPVTTKYFDTHIENTIGCLNVKTKFTSLQEGTDAQRMTLLTQGDNGPITIIHSLTSPEEDSNNKSQEPHCRYGSELRKAWVHEVLENRSPAAMIPEKKPLNGSDTDTDTLETLMNSNSSLLRRRGSQKRVEESPTQQLATAVGGGGGSVTTITTGVHRESSGDTEEEGDCETVSTPGTVGSRSPLMNEVTPSATEWIGVTTNSEECSYSSELEETDSQYEYSNADFVDHPFAWEFGSNTVLSPSCAASDRVSCTIWDHREIKKADLSVLDISSAIIARVEAMPETCDYFYGGAVLSVLLAFIPAACRLCRLTIETAHADDHHLSLVDLLSLVAEKMSGSLSRLLEMGFGDTFTGRIILLVSLLQRIILSCLFFFLLAVAERVFKQRFLYAKLFSHLTSSRRARKSELPHFRLNKVRNIKTWLSIRSYLKKRGPQRSVDVIVSAACLITLLLLSFLSVELLRDSVHLHSQCNIEAFAWSLALGMFLLRFMTLGTKINQKYRNLSVLITEQINLYLQIEQKPNKKEELMVANSVLKLAADLLKELECPFKISGLSANPILYTITKVVILSALSGILSEMLGFKLKLHKIKIK